jgi:DNA helicase-2/ATP-dependent DNA helicase PcrA
MQIKEHLNSPQTEAVKHCGGPLLILAGAGSGKTRVLTYRIAYLLGQERVSPFNILAITFTNKAANEMRERVDSLVGQRAERMWICTFHSACVRILRKEISNLGYDSNFVIYDSADQQTLIKQCLKEFNIDDKRFSPRSIAAGISLAKNKLIRPKEYEDNASDFYEQTISKVYNLYQARLKKNNALDFDDLLMNTVLLFEKHPEILADYQDRFKYILVDEYQDTNYAQYRLVRLLVREHQNICVVGDDDQSVYSFRGADIQNILDFERDYPKTKVVRLEQNYRSTKMILDAANELIKNNNGRKTKKLWTENPGGSPVALYTAQDEHKEAYYIAQKIIEGKNQKNRLYKDYAVLYRTNAQSRVIEEVLMRNNIPYTMFGGLKFYERKEIKDIAAYLKVISNTADTISLQRIINIPRRGIGEASLAKVSACAAEKGISLYEAMGQAEAISGLTSRIAMLIVQFHALLEELRTAKDNTSVTALTSLVFDKSGYLKELEGEKTIEAETRIENLKEFLTVTAEYDKGSEENSLEEFLSGVSLVADIDSLDERTDAVVMMTLHSAKGLEFSVVFMIGMEEGLFPHFRSLNSLQENEIEEERRLCYVGITRAREELHLLNARQRMLYGNHMHNQLSRFVGEIPDHLLSPVGNGMRQGSSWGSAKKSQNASQSASAAKISPVGVSGGLLVLGDKVEHGKWGQGVVVSVKGENADTEISVAFPDQGVKTLIAKYAPLKKI